jgi:cell fate (sporulation/competence/biofilm development) regulator YmcA (YheA/YmcA/DUF963 family)
MPTHAFTGVRAERKEFYQTLRAARAITAGAYRDLVAGLRVEEERARRRAAAAVERRETVRIAKRVAKEVPRSDVVLDLRTTATVRADGSVDAERKAIIENRLAEACANLVGHAQAYLSISQAGRSVFSGIIDINNTTKWKIWYNDLMHYFFRTGYDWEDSMFQSGPNRRGVWKRLAVGTPIRVVIELRSTLPSRRAAQSYRDSIDHCVFAPLIQFMETTKEDKADSTVKRITQRIQKLQRMAKQYDKGISEEALDEVASILNVRIDVFDLVGNIRRSYNEKSKSIVSFTNTRMNHVEMGKLIVNREYVRVDVDELRAIIQEHRDTDTFYHICADMKNDVPRSIKSIKGAWAVFNEDHDIFQAMNESIGLNRYAVNAVRQVELNEFLRAGRIINSVPISLCDDPNNLEGVTQIDMEKAYTQHKSADFYRGFPGKITYFGMLPEIADVSAFLAAHVGIYEAEVLVPVGMLCNMASIVTGGAATDGNTTPIVVNALRRTVTLPSVELEWYISRGASFRLINAAISTDTFDFDYSPEMLEDGRYCTWAGKLGSDHPDEIFQFPANEEWASHLKSELGERTRYYKSSGLASVHHPKQSYKTYHHILAFITAYTRINVMKIMETIPKENLVKVIMDGVYFRGEVPKTHVPVRVKECIKHQGFTDSWYTETEAKAYAPIRMDFMIPAGKIDNVIVLTGAGGSGKSHSVLNSGIFPGILYVVPTKDLGKDMRKKTGVRWTTIHKFIGIGCRSLKDQGREFPPVVFIDELTMMDKAWIDKAIEMYPSVLFFIAGDVDEKRWYQCRNGTPTVGFSEVWRPTSSHHQVHYTADYRSLCPVLAQMKVAIREKMRSVFTDGGAGDARVVAGFVQNNYPTVSFKDAVSMFKPGDIWIAGTIKMGQRLLDQGVSCEEGVGSYTIHGFQGRTIEEKRTFISFDMFEYAMLYTAISRVRRMSQLVLVRY